MGAAQSVSLTGPAAASAGTTSLINLDPPGLDAGQVLYLRRQIWGDKLLRKLSPEQLARYLAEQPYVSPIAGITSKAVTGTRRGPGRSRTIRQSARTLATKATRRASRSNVSEEVVTTDVSDDTYQRGDKWVVPGVGEFSNRAAYTFNGNTLPSGLTASNNDEQQGAAPYPFRFDAANVTVSEGTLNLKVPGNQDGRKKPISCAEVTTDETAILHASVRMTAKMSGQSGVCHGAFFYRNDQAESDIEYLTDPTSNSNRVNPNSTLFWYSNQSTLQGGQPSHQSADPPPTVEGYHTYRLDWSPSFTAYYVDGKLQSKLTDNVPNKSGLWVWNNWSNGDPGWSCGPPKNDSILRIKDITMYYDTVAISP